MITFSFIYAGMLLGRGIEALESILIPLFIFLDILLEFFLLLGLVYYYNH